MKEIIIRLKMYDYNTEDQSVRSLTDEEVDTVFETITGENEVAGWAITDCWVQESKTDSIV